MTRDYKSETNIVRSILMRGSEIGGRLFRQQTGVGWIGKSYQIKNPTPNQLAAGLQRGDVIIRDARVFHAGFEGLSDTGGIYPQLITPDYVGKTVGIHCEVEVKTLTGKARDMQINYINTIKSLGGRAGIARSADDAEKIMRGLM